MPEKAPGSPELNQDSGTSSPESWASWDRATSSWRTCVLSLLGESMPFLGPWPTSGMMRNGRLSPQPPWVPPTVESESSSWPTGMAWATPTTPAPHDSDFTAGQGYQNQENIAAQAVAWATPSSRDHKDSPGMATTGTNPDGSERSRLDRIPPQAFAWAGAMPSTSEDTTAPSGPFPPMPGAGLNPRFTRWLMGFPDGWLNSEHWATRSSRSAPTSSGDDSLCEVPHED